MVVGFDFGTHQTKICIEDRSDPNRPVYKFWKFKTPDGESYTLPSVVQINKDDTLTYGYVDKSCAKEMCLDAGREPQMPNLQKPVMSFNEPEPKLKLPEKPKAQKKDWKDVLQALNNGGKSLDELEWEKACEEARLDYDQDLRIWKSRYGRAKEKYDKELAVYEEALDKYQRLHSEWEEKNAQREPGVYRYFKQATFTNAAWWHHSIHPDLLCIWYIANILFDLEAEYGQTFSIQFGFPTNARLLKSRRRHAYRLLLSAYRLVEDVFKGDKTVFLLSTYHELTDLTEYVEPTDDNIINYGLLALPEAYANLVTATAKKQIPKGISFVIDIGGGTTDISLFNIDENDLPNIYGYTSIDKGLNYIIECAHAETDVWKQNSIYDIPEGERGQAISSLLLYIEGACGAIVGAICDAFEEVDLHKSAILDALENRVVVYSGGGSTFDVLCQKVEQFTDVRRMDHRIWNGFYLDEANAVTALAPVLSTALGLSVQRENDDVHIADTQDIFNHLPKKTGKEERIWGRRPEEMYGMMDD